MSNFKVKPDTDPQELCTMVALLVEEFRPSMVRGHRYPLETMCGNAFWDGLTNTQQREAGIYMTQLMACGAFDFDYADIGGKETNQYQL